MQCKQSLLIGTLIGIFFFRYVFAMNWTNINLTVTDIDPARGGEIIVMVFQEEGFPKEHNKALKTYSFSAEKPKKVLEINVPMGDFAIKIHHDEDVSGTITKNWTGVIPAEGLGFSSGAKIFFGPPSFKAAKMQLPDNGNVTIAIRYP